MSEEKKLSKELQEIIDKVEKMTVIELADLVKALEDKFGVSASAPIAVAASTPAQSEEAEEKTSFDVLIKAAGTKKIAVIKVVREATGLGLKESKELVEAAPKEVKQGIGKEEAEELKKKLEEAGATVELK